MSDFEGKCAKFSPRPRLDLRGITASWNMGEQKEVGAMEGDYLKGFIH